MRTAEEIYDGYLEVLGAISRESVITMMKLYHSEQEESKIIRAYDEGFKGGRNNYTREYGDDWSISDGKQWLTKQKEKI